MTETLEYCPPQKPLAIGDLLLIRKIPNQRPVALSRISPIMAKLFIDSVGGRKMNEWQYSDYVTLAGNERLVRLRLHVKEVSDHLSGLLSRSISDMSYSKYNIQEYLRQIKIELQDLERQAGHHRRAGYVR